MRILLLILIVCYTVVIKANFIESFYLKVNNDKIELEFTIRAGNLCNGIDIYRTIDTMSDYKLIGVIPGVCGSTNEAVKFNFTDEYPVLNRVNYYKINFGGIIYEAKSSILNRKVMFNEVLIYPNPSQGLLNWQIENDENNIIEFKFYDFMGKETFVFSSNESINSLDVSTWNKGIYFLTFYNKQGILVKKRFVVL